MKKKILHIITGLKQGGAETALYRLLCSIKKTDFNSYVIVLGGKDFYSHKFENLGISVFYLNISVFNWPIKIFLCMKIIKKINPDVVQTWMYHADLFGGVCAKLCKVKNIIWGIRGEGKELKFTTWLIKMISAALSWVVPQHIVSNSRVAAENHISSGYCKRKFCIIANGFDFNYFVPKPEKSFLENILRINFSDNCIVLGTLARFHKVKGYANLLQAVDRVCDHVNNVYFVLCGRGCNKENPELVKLLNQSKYANRISLINGTSDALSYLNALDVFLLPSISEGFPNVLSEAMLCGLPCVATDTGDTAYILNDTGILISPNNSQQLADACISIINKTNNERRSMGEKARDRIKNNFSLESYVEKFVGLY